MGYTMLRLVVLCAVFVLVRGETTAVSECQLFPAELPINQYVEGCTQPPCLLPQEQDVVIHVIFKAPRNLQTMTTLAEATVNFGIGNVNLNYPLGANAVTCNFFTNTYCPLLKGEVVQYTLRMYIETFFFVGTAATVEFRINDENSQPLWCIRLPIVIAPPAGESLRRTNATLEAFV